MQKINSEISLRDAIVQLENKQADEGKLLKEQFYLVYESMKPVNLILSTFKEAAESKELKDDLLSTAIGFGTGYISKLLFEGVSRNPVKKIIGAALQYGITNVVAKHPEAIKVFGNGLLNIIRSKLHNGLNGAPQKVSRGRLDLL